MIYVRSTHGTWPMDVARYPVHGPRAQETLHAGPSSGPPAQCPPTAPCVYL